MPLHDTGRAAAAMVSMIVFCCCACDLHGTRGKRYDTMTYVHCLTLYIGIPLVHKVYPKLVQVLSPTLGTNWYTFYIRLGYTFRTQSWNIFLSIIALWLAF